MLSRIGFLFYDKKFDVDKFKEDGVNLRLRQASEREEHSENALTVIFHLLAKEITFFIAWHGKILP